MPWAHTFAVLALVGCAGDLENPQRFDFVLGADAAVGTPGDGDGDMGDGDTGDGDGDTGGDGDTVADDLPECLTTVISGTCGSVGCHAAGQAQVDLVSPGLVDRLLDQTADKSPF